MKICWDNLEGVYLSNRGNLRKGLQTIWEIDTCEVCNEPFLSPHKDAKFCTGECYDTTKFGNNYSKGIVKSKQTLTKLSNSLKGRKLSDEHIKQIVQRQSGEKSHRWKGGVKEKNIPLYDTYNVQLEWAEETKCIIENGLRILQIKCTKCGKWFTPTTSSVHRRIRVLNNKKGGGCRFYCSDGCRVSCELFNQKKYPKGYKQDKYYTDNEYKVWRDEVFRRANYECEYCGENAENAHHIKPKKLEPFFALDPDYGIACCKKCHNKYGHKDECAAYILSSVVCGSGG